MMRVLAISFHLRVDAWGALIKKKEQFWFSNELRTQKSRKRFHYLAEKQFSPLNLAG
jgi:hypothetical protein